MAKLKSGLLLGEGEEVIMELEAELWAEGSNIIQKIIGQINKLLTDHFSQHFDLFCVAGKLIGGFQDHGLALKGRMVHKGSKGCLSQASLTDAFVPVLVAGKRIF